MSPQEAVAFLAKESARVCVFEEREKRSRRRSQSACGHARAQFKWIGRRPPPATVEAALVRGVEHNPGFSAHTFTPTFKQATLQHSRGAMLSVNWHTPTPSSQTTVSGMTAAASQFPKKAPKCALAVMQEDELACPWPWHGSY